MSQEIDNVLSVEPAQENVVPSSETTEGEQQNVIRASTRQKKSN